MIIRIDMVCTPPSAPSKVGEGLKILEKGVLRRFEKLNFCKIKYYILQSIANVVALSLLHIKRTTKHNYLSRCEVCINKRSRFLLTLW